MEKRMQYLFRYLTDCSFEGIFWPKALKQDLGVRITQNEFGFKITLCFSCTARLSLVRLLATSPKIVAAAVFVFPYRKT